MKYNFYSSLFLQSLCYFVLGALLFRVGCPESCGPDSVYELSEAGPQLETSFFLPKKEKKKRKMIESHCTRTLYMNLSIFVFKWSRIYVSSSGLNGMYESVQFLHQWPDLTVSHCYHVVSDCQTHYDSSSRQPSTGG